MPRSRYQQNRKDAALLLASFSFGDALLLALEIFFFVIWIWILITILSDLFRDHETLRLVRRRSGSCSSSSSRS